MAQPKKYYILRTFRVEILFWSKVFITYQKLVIRSGVDFLIFIFLMDANLIWKDLQKRTSWKVIFFVVYSDLGKTELLRNIKERNLIFNQS